MLYQIDNKNKENSIYICDFCKEKINSNNKYSLYTQYPKAKNPIKKLDLCERCYKSLERGVEKWKKI